MCDILWILDIILGTYSNYTQNFNNQTFEKKKRKKERQEVREGTREGGSETAKQK